MAKKLIPFAIAYDFDGTLAPGNMQEYDFVPAVGMTKKAFWKEVGELAKQHDADNILMYMKHMLDKADAAHVPVRKKDFVDYGRSVSLFDGVGSWFDRVDKYGKERGIKVQHFIISSGIREMVEGTPIAKKFSSIYALEGRVMSPESGTDSYKLIKPGDFAISLRSFQGGVEYSRYRGLISPAYTVLRPKLKTDEFVPKQDRPVPFENMVFIGDGETDIPCFRLVKDQGGHAIAVYKPSTKGAKGKAEKLIEEGRVNFIAPANYSEGSDIDTFIKGVIDKVAADGVLKQLGKRE